jgi:hypothetical protein
MAFCASLKRISIPVLIGAAVIFGVTYWFNHFSSEGKRRARVEAASVHAKTVVAPLLAKQKRFAEIQVFGWYTEDGNFGVRGGVDSEADWKDLEALIVSSHPPTSIRWDVYVGQRHVTNVTVITP